MSLSWASPLETLQRNTAMQWNLLEAAAEGCPDARIVIVGSCDEYGNVLPADNPVNETCPLKPASPYALSKVVQDLMARQYAETHGLNATRIRPFLQTGPRRSARFAAGSFARQIAEIAAGLREPIVSVGSIDLLRDFTDVRDAVRGYGLIAERGVAGEVYNLASGIPHSLRDMLRVMLQTADVDAQLVHDPALAREGEAPLLVGDPSKFRAATGWQPEISFEASAADTVIYWLNRTQALLAHEGRS